MTPFGAKLRELRQARGIDQKTMAAALGVSGSYLSALEHGKRGRPPWAMVQKIIGYFNVIWDEAEELERLSDMSDPRVVVDTARLSPEATALANRFAAEVRRLDAGQIAEIDRILDGARTVLSGRPDDR
jgi:transcriptional regulator with XRE-family HTH domain